MKPNSIAYIKGGEDAPQLRENVKFFQKRGYVLVTATIFGMPSSETGFYGFHIHSGTSCTEAAFSKTGQHYDIRTSQHPQHSGDLPPLMLCNGGSYMTVATDRFTTNDIIGRTVVIHKDVDDFTTQPSGNAGTKIACGVIHKR